ncbi:MAG: hypothetical protein PHY47_00900 [Lachnospiraceae bacterium]|nr:hypothetical protein [Lachnospiraceae bacterium]
MAKSFSMIKDKDIKLIGTSYLLNGIGEEGKDLRGKFTGIDTEGRYEFLITSRDTDLEAYSTRTPNEDIK